MTMANLDYILTQFRQDTAAWICRNKKVGSRQQDESHSNRTEQNRKLEEEHAEYKIKINKFTIEWNHHGICCFQNRVRLQETHVNASSGWNR